MKKIKILAVISLIFCLTGCFKRDNMENINIYTTNYPTYYVTNILYGDKAEIKSIYPTGVFIDIFKLTDKNIEDYSKGDLFIYNGLSEEKKYAVDMLNNNDDLKIIDSTMSMEYENRIEELWLDPSNLLMIAQNIKNGLYEYVSNRFIENEIDKSYKELKVVLSEFDVELKKIGENADNPTIIVSDNLFLYLKKYGINVISLEGVDDVNFKALSEVKTMFDTKSVSYIFTVKNEDVSDTIKDIVKEKNVELLEFDPISNLSDDDFENKVCYIDKMKANIELLKKELYQ